MKIFYDQLKARRTSLHSISGVCPNCGYNVEFNIIATNVYDQKNGKYYLCEIFFENNRYLGLRYCNRCNAIVFFEKIGDRLFTYPRQRISFDTSNIPENIIRTLNEAIECHSNQCYTAAAIMVRRTLEEICVLHNAEGKRLIDRIKDLKKKIFLPEPFFDAMDNLRLLGNDAAHVKAKDYENIGNKEVEVGIDITKEILKALYQYTDIMDKLEQLKSKPD